MSDSPLATVEKIISVHEIKDSDFIEQVFVLGWSLVAKKGEFKPGDLCVFARIDSIFPQKTEFEFLRSKKFRIRTQTLRKTLSQGICFPLSILPSAIRSMVLVKM